MSDETNGQKVDAPDFLHRLVENAFSWGKQDCNYLNPKHIDAFIAATRNGMPPEAAAAWVAAGSMHSIGPTLDERMKAAGMFTIEEMMGVTPITKWKVQAGMTDLDAFNEWLDRKVSDYLRMKASYDLGYKDEKDELYEWVLAHAGAFSSIRENFRAAIGSQQPEPQQVSL